MEWEDKPKQIERLALPFQTVETINESRATRERDSGALFGGSSPPDFTRNLLVWGDNKLVMSSLLAEYAGKVKLVYIDPPFDTGTDFSFSVRVGGSDLTKAPSVLEETAYRDTWGRGRSSYLSMLYERITLIHELLSGDGTLFLHVGRNVSHYVKLLCDEVFGEENFVNEITWKRSHAHGDTGQGAKHFGRVTEAILIYRKSAAATWHAQYVPYSDEVVDRDYKYVDESTGHRYRLMPVDGPGGAAKGNPYFEFLGVKGYFRYSEQTMQELYDAGEV